MRENLPIKTLEVSWKVFGVSAAADLLTPLRSLAETQPAKIKPVITAGLQPLQSGRFVVFKYQEVDWVVGFERAALRHGLCDGRHHELHQVDPQGKSRGLQPLLFLPLHLLHASMLKDRRSCLFLPVRMMEKFLSCRTHASC